MIELDEELPGQDRPSRTRARPALALAAVALVAAAVVVGVRHSGGDDHRAAPPASASPSTTGGGVSRGPVEVTVPACGSGSDDGLGCIVHLGVPTSLLVVLRSTFPGTQVRNGYTVTGRDRRLYTRVVVLVGDHRYIYLAVGVSERTDRTYRVQRSDDDTTTRFRTFVGTGAQRLLVRVDAHDGAHRAGLDRATLEGFAHDARLLAPL